MHALMKLDANLKENHATPPVLFSENYVIPHIKKEMPFDEAHSSKGYLQDFDHDLDELHANGSSASLMYGVQAPCFDSFGAFPHVYCLSNFDFYECKPFAADNEGGHGQVMDNFQSGGYLNHNQINPLDMIGSDQSYIPLNLQETKAVNFVVPDEVSCVSADNNGYCKKSGMNKNNKAYPSTRRPVKVGKKCNLVKGQWTVDEDRLLNRLVEQHGMRKWSHIAQMLPGRIGKQCRERWHNHLRPNIKKDTWSEEEDKVLIQAHAEIGNKWAEIAKWLPGRTENSIKNHWNATRRRQFSKRKCRSKHPRCSLLQEYIKSLNIGSGSTKHHAKPSPTDAITSVNNKSKASDQTPAEDLCDRLLPYFDFNEVPDFDFDEKLFEDDCSIDSLIHQMPASAVDEKILEDVVPMTQSEIKEMDLLEMITQV